MNVPGLEQGPMSRHPLQSALQFIIIIIIIIGQTALFELQPSLEDSTRLAHSWELDHPLFTSLDIAIIMFLHSKAFSLASNPHFGG
jgi:hypothetical protein